MPHSVSLGADLALAVGTAPSTLVGASPHVGWRSSGATVGLSVRLGFLHATTQDGSAAFAWTVGRADGCSTLWPTRPARLSACARIETGALDATGLDVVAPRSQSRAWLSAGPLLRAEWTFAAPMFVEADFAAMFHVTADRFYFLPDTTVYQVPLVGLGGSAGVGVTFL
jgi:hypothetical protein